MSFKINHHKLSRIASSNGHQEDSPYFEGWKAYDDDAYDAIENPNGVIQMGLAENELTFDVLEDWLKNNPKASICSDEGLKQFRDIALFQDYHGLPEFRKAVAKFMGKVRGGRVTFDPDRIVMSGGATGAHETLIFCLADPGDAILVPTPYYPGFDRDLRWRTGVKLIPVKCDSSNNFQVTREALESAYEMAELDNIRVKGLLITNPSNPLGTILDRETLRSIVNFTNERNIHLVCDEIYAATVFRKPDFISITEIIEEGNVECDLDLIHVVYSLSKDMGLPGFRVGIIYSYNDFVVKCARRMSSFGLVSSQTQHLIASMLSDDEFVEKFILESKRRLEERHKAFTRGLAKIGIGCLQTSNAGLFIWMDLHRFLKEQKFESEMELWRLIIKEVKVNVSPGSSFHCSEPGWFRVCFAYMDDKLMEVALERIKKFVKQMKKEAMKPAKLCWQDSLNRHSFSSRNDFLMSPHSPFPQSPLVPART